MAQTIKTKEELNANIAKARNEIRQGENAIKQMRREVSKKTRKARTNRLIQRGALLESMIKEPDTLTNEQIKKLLRAAFNSATVREMAVAFRAENAAGTAGQNGEKQAAQAQ